MNKFKKGQVVWAKLKGFPWWPAVVAQVKTNEQLGVDYIIVNFLNENSHANLQDDKVQDFKQQYLQYSRVNNKNKKLIDAIEMGRKIVYGESTYDEEKKKFERKKPHNELRHQQQEESSKGVRENKRVIKAKDKTIKANSDSESEDEDADSEAEVEAEDDQQLDESEKTQNRRGKRGGKDSAEEKKNKETDTQSNSQRQTRKNGVGVDLVELPAKNKRKRKSSDTNDSEQIENGAQSEQQSKGIEIKGVPKKLKSLRDSSMPSLHEQLLAVQEAQQKLKEQQLQQQPQQNNAETGTKAQSAVVVVTQNKTKIFFEKQLEEQLVKLDQSIENHQLSQNIMRQVDIVFDEISTLNYSIDELKDSKIPRLIRCFYLHYQSLEKEERRKKKFNTFLENFKKDLLEQYLGVEEFQKYKLVENATTVKKERKSSGNKLSGDEQTGDSLMQNPIQNVNHAQEKIEEKLFSNEKSTPQSIANLNSASNNNNNNINNTNSKDKDNNNANREIMTNSINNNSNINNNNQNTNQNGIILTDEQEQIKKKRTKVCKAIADLLTNMYQIEKRTAQQLTLRFEKKILGMYSVSDDNYKQLVKGFMRMLKNKVFEQKEIQELVDQDLPILQTRIRIENEKLDVKPLIQNMSANF